MELMILPVAVVTVGAYICRLSKLSIGKNKPWVIIMHMALAMSAGWAGYHSYIGDMSFGDVVSLLGAGAWIVVSLPTWKRGVPLHFYSRPVRLEPIDLNSVSGGKQQQ